MAQRMFELVLDAQAELGEGPLWDAGRQRLWFVDILRGYVHAFDPATGADAVFEVGQPVGALALSVQGDVVLAARDGFFRLSPATGETTLAAIVEPDLEQNRMNDGYCDARGRFWAGTMAMDGRREAGALYRLDPSGRVTCHLTGVTTSNGLDWSPDGQTMYYVDTGTRRIDMFDFHVDDGRLANRRPFVTIPEDQGKPDGLVVDAEGGVWVALWGGGALNRYSPSGQLERRVKTPVTHPTKCAFGGPALDELFVTTAWRPLSAEQRAAQAHAGGVYRCHPGVKGRAAHAFGG